MSNCVRLLTKVARRPQISALASLHRCYSVPSIARSITKSRYDFNKSSALILVSRHGLHTSPFKYALPEHKVIALPSLSPTMETGTVVSWSKQKGDKVEEGDLLAEIETDKAIMGMEAADAGYIAKLLVPAGKKDIPVNTPLCVMVENESDIEAFKDFEAAGPVAGTSQAPPKEAKAPEQKKPTSVEPPKPVAQHQPMSQSTDRVFISPLARQKARESGISVDNLSGRGTGPWGDVRLNDVQKFIESGGAGGASISAPAFGSPGDAFTDINLSGMRKTIAKRLLQSSQTIPHYSLTVDICLDLILPLRERINNRLIKEKTKLSVNDFLMKAAAHACLQVPECNSAWNDTFIRQYSSVDISVAVATPNGLITPIVFDVQNKGLKAINQDVQRLAEKAREGKLQPQEFQGGTFTISNLGMFGVKNFSAIINPPQACILAVGSAEKRIVPNDKSPNGFQSSTFVSVTLCCDHRVVDGAVGAQWLGHFKQYLEDPSSMLL